MPVGITRVFPTTDLIPRRMNSYATGLLLSQHETQQALAQILLKKKREGRAHNGGGDILSTRVLGEFVLLQEFDVNSLHVITYFCASSVTSTVR